MHRNLEKGAKERECEKERKREGGTDSRIGSPRDQPVVVLAGCIYVTLRPTIRRRPIKHVKAGRASGRNPLLLLLLLFDLSFHGRNEPKAEGGVDNASSTNARSSRFPRSICHTS